MVGETTVNGNGGAIVVVDAHETNGINADDCEECDDDVDVGDDDRDDVGDREVEVERGEEKHV